MNIFPPAIYYISLRAVVKVLYYHCIRHFSVRRFLVAMFYLIIMVVMSVINIIFRLADEIFFPSYRKIKIKEPVFIISNPRSGTTLLHRLLCHDEEKFVHIRLFHTLVPSITFCKLVDFIAACDNRIGHPLHKFFQWVDKVMFAGWEDVHAAGFNRAEEDEGLYFLSGISPALSLITPYLNHFRELYILDQWDEKKRERIKKFYKATLQRWMYVLGPDKQFLCKSVMSTGRLQLLMELFPDVRIIYLVRNPYNAIPSFIEMFTSTWKIISPGIKENSLQYRELAELAILYYRYFNEQKYNFKPENWITLTYEDLVSSPHASVLKIYDQFGLEMTSRFETTLKKESEVSRTFKSKHQYSLAQYGLTKADIDHALPKVFEEYGFKE